MVKFEKISKYENTDINLPSRKTEFSAGYDFEVVEDIIIPSYFDCVERLKIENANELLTIEQMAN